LRTLGSLTTTLVMAALIVAIWVFTVRSIEAQRQEVLSRVVARVSNQALIFSDQIARQILAIDQTLRALSMLWEGDPRNFDLDAWRGHLVSVTGISRDVLLVDERGIVRQSSIAEAVGKNVADRDFFRAALDDPASRERLFIGAATLDDLVRVWHMNVSRGLRYADGSFAGMIVMDYRSSALAEVFSQTNVDENGLVALIGETDGLIRAAVGPPTVDPEAAQLGTPMMTALRATPTGIWIGPSSPDSVPRVHAFRSIPERGLAVVVAMDEGRAMAPAADWRFQARMFAIGITVALIVIVLMTFQGNRAARRREAALAEDRATLAQTIAQLEIARAEAARKTEQLEATLRGMTDGVSMMDGHFCLVEWNQRFPEIIGVPAGMLRVGTPMEEILRAQARGGQFGDVDVEAEVRRRMEILRAGRFGITQRRTPDGRVLELRRNGLPDGGFVTLYSDITAHKRTEEALRDARQVAEDANIEKSRFVAIVSHEIRTPLNGLLNTLRLLGDSNLPAAQRPILDMARASGDALSSLINDILEMSRAEAGELALRRSVFALRDVLEASMEVFQSLATARGIRFHLDIADDVPATLRTDPARVRQILLNLLSNAVKFAHPGEVRLTAAMDGVARNQGILRLAVRDAGPVIPEADRARLFRPFSRLEREVGSDTGGTGLGLAICLSLTDAMGGRIGCDPWGSPDGVAGNEFWLTLPVELPPPAPAVIMAPQSDEYEPPAAIEPDDLARPLPRTRILLVEDVRANQLITAMLLRRLGHMVDVADDGPAAIAAARGTPYDVIFMDIFMPGMSGHEATRHIRESGGLLARLPIIALTANASEHDADVFRVAGFSGVLPKPVSIEQLTDALRDHVWMTRSRTQAAAAPAAEEGAAPAPPTHEAGPVLATDRLAELVANLPNDALLEMVEECLTDLDLRLPALRSAITAGVPGAIVAHSHAMMGMASSYGMEALERVLRPMVVAARDGDVSTFGPGTILAVEAELTRSAAALRAAVRKEVA